MYTGNSPMPFLVPGPPRAIEVTFDSITLIWAAPKHGNVESYKVLYHSTKDTKFKTVYSILEDCVIKGYLMVLSMNSRSKQLCLVLMVSKLRVKYSHPNHRVL